MCSRKSFLYTPLLFAYFIFIISCLIDELTKIILTKNKHDSSTTKGPTTRHILHLISHVLPITLENNNIYF